MTARGLVAAIAACTACAPGGPGGTASPHGGAGARSLRYAIITVDRPAGAAELDVAADGSWRAHFTFNDRGRGPDLTATSTLDARGFPLTTHVTGHAYDKQAVDEVLAAGDGTLSWHSPAEHGSAAVGAGFYVSQADALGNAAQLLQACLHAPGKQIPLLPAGEAWIEDDTVVPIAIGGTTRQLHEVALAGLGFAPQLTWLDERGDLFGTASAWTSVVPVSAEERRSRR